jgi:phosphoglycerate dehydrogenase-like enzyme
VSGVERVYVPSQLHEALRDADFIVIATPLTPETRGLVDREALASAKPGAGWINVGRADVLDHDALVEFIGDGRVGNAILDVLPQEPLPPSSVLWSSPNLIVNPHVGADDPATYMAATMNLVFENLKLQQRGLPLKNVVDRLKQY